MLFVNCGKKRHDVVHYKSFLFCIFSPHVPVAIHYRRINTERIFLNLIDIDSLVFVLFIILHNPSVPDSQYGEESEIDNGRGKVVNSAIVNYIVIADSDEKYHREHQKCEADIEQSLCLPVFFFCSHC